MGLIDILQEIGKAYGIPKSELILEEAKFFQKKHKDHGCYQIELFYNETGLLYGIDLKCLKGDSSNGGCEQDEFPTSIIYERDENFVEDLKAQKERRERENYEDN